jgi:hypothetical protein
MQQRFVEPVVVEEVLDAPSQLGRHTAAREILPQVDHFLVDDQALVVAHLCGARRRGKTRKRSLGA